MTTNAAVIRVALRDRGILAFALLAVFFLMLDVALLAWKIPGLLATKPFLALHYNIFFGIDRIGPGMQAFVMPAFGAAVLVVNAGLALRLAVTERLVALTLVAGAAAVNALLFIASLFVVLANL